MPSLTSSRLLEEPRIGKVRHVPPLTPWVGSMRRRKISSLNSWRMLKEPDWEVRCTAAYALCRIGAGAKDAVPQLF